MQAASQKMYAAGAQPGGAQAGPDMGGAGFNGGANAGPQGGQNNGSSSAQQGAEDADFEEVK